MAKLLLIAGMMALPFLASNAMAQNGGYIPPGQFPQYGGSYMIQPPSPQLPTYVTPNYGGGYTIQPPGGQFPTYITPQGGYMGGPGINRNIPR